MKIIREFTALYHKLPEKKRNVNLDGVVAVLSNGTTYSVILKDENSCEIGRRSLSAAVVEKLDAGESVQIGNYQVELDECTYKTQSQAVESDNLSTVTTKAENIESNKSQSEVSQSALTTKLSGSSTGKKKTFLFSTKSLNNSNISATSLTPATGAKRLLEVAEKENIGGDSYVCDSKLIASTQSHKRPRNFISPLLSQKTNDIKEITKSRDLDNFLETRMRPHQIEGALWIIDHLTVDCNRYEKDLDSKKSKGDDSYLDFEVSDSDSDEDGDFTYSSKTAESSAKFEVGKSSARLDDVLGVILADEMGLGKTLTAIAVIWTFIRPDQSYGFSYSGGRGIVVCPSSLIENWEKEIKNWLGVRIHPLSVKGGNASGKRTPRQIIESFQYSNAAAILIISYEMYRNNADIINKTSKLEIIVCDEGHRLKNIEGTKTIAALNGNLSSRRLILSGTPIQNDLDELYAMVSFVKPNALGSVRSFQYNYSVPIKRGNDVQATPDDVEKGKEASNRLKLLMKQMMIRRTQADILAKLLPPKYDVEIFCSLSTFQLSQYRMIVEDISRQLNISSSMVTGDVSDPYYFVLREQDEPSDGHERDHNNRSTILPALLKLRQICSSMDLDQSSFGKLSFPSSNLSSMRGTSKQPVKMQIVDKLVTEIMHSKMDKVVIVSNFVKSLDALSHLAMSKGWKFIRLDGSTPTDQRQSLIDSFNRSSDDRRIFLLSSKAGGVGINLIGASRLIMFDIDWNPAVDHQAMSRVWREGQKFPVFIYRLISKDVIEESILMRQRSKSKLACIMENGDIESELVSDTRNGKRMSLTTSDVINLIQPKYPKLIYKDSIECDEPCDESSNISSALEEYADANESASLDSDQGDSSDDIIQSVLNELTQEGLVQRFHYKLTKPSDTDMSCDETASAINESE